MIDNVQFSRDTDAWQKELEVISDLDELARPNTERINAKPFHWGKLLNSIFRLTVLLKDWDRLAQEQLYKFKRNTYLLFDY